MEEPPELDVVEHAERCTTDNFTDARLRPSFECKQHLKILNDTERKLLVFRQGIVKLKQYYEMQMVLMKSYLHGEDGVSVEDFLSKLIKIMELMKEIFVYLHPNPNCRASDQSPVTSDCNDIDYVSEMKLRTGEDRQCIVVSNNIDVTEDLSDLTPIVSTTSLLSPQIPTITSPQFDASDVATTGSSILTSYSSIMTSHDSPLTPYTSVTTLVSSPVSSSYSSVLTSQGSALYNFNEKRVANENRNFLVTTLPQAETIVNLPGLSQAQTSSVITTAVDGQFSPSHVATHNLLVSTTTMTDETCHFCKTTFTTKRDLNRHMRRHTGEKPFKCEICSKNFSRKDFLRKHKLTHTGEKPHTCAQCNKSFSQRSNLNKHVLTHTKIHRFVCRVCQRGFHQMNNLHRHEQLHCHSNKHFRCTWCEREQYEGVGCLKTFLDKKEANNTG